MRLPRLLTEPRNDGGVGIMCHCEERSDAAICVGDCRRNSGRGKPLPYGIAGSAGASPRLPLEGKLSPQATDEVSIFCLFSTSSDLAALGHLPLEGKAFFASPVVRCVSAGAGVLDSPLAASSPAVGGRGTACGG